MEKLAVSLGVEKHVILLGTLRGKELVDALGAQDIFVTASKSENMPLSVLEAMATGLPVIGARALGIPEIVKDNENGFLFTPGNIAEIAEQITRLIENTKLMRKFSLASRKLSLNYSKEKIAKLLERKYESVIEHYK